VQVKAVSCLAAVLLLSGCSAPQPQFRHSTFAMGSTVEFTVEGLDEPAARAAVDEAVADLNYLEQALHAWHAGSLGRMNSLFAVGGRFTAAAVVLPLIEQTARLSEQSGELFNPAFGELFRLWGFQSDDPPIGPPPSAEEIARVLAHRPRMSDLRVQGIEIESSNPHVRLDFGAFAQGYAADRVIERFRERGIRNAIVNVSGDVRVIGGHADRPWRIGIRNPRGEGVLASVLMEGDEALVTSGDYERFFMHEGKRYHHILDPRTGYPSRGVTSVTVLHRSAAVADAAATALMIAGVAEWRAVARRMGVTHALLVDDTGRVHMDAATARRVKFEIDPAPDVVLVE
jgi:thiamine biosynthesis lipoprotein